MKIRFLGLFTGIFFFSLSGKAQVTDTLVCPVIVVTAPAKNSVVEGKPALLRVQPFGKAYAKYALTYNWTVSNGTITEGQGTPVIKVDTKGLKGQSITTSVEIGGLRYDCNNFASITIDVTGKN